ncbi:MAG: hypothetical protein PWP23_1249 [Candidatus Sumerlaeota bacterium]|nr:hypothetical protein [Candidatus Sumerlaeota bacterium]
MQFAAGNDSRLPHRPGAEELAAWPAEWRERCIAEAEDVLAGRVTFFHLDRHQLADPIDWSRDEDSGLSVPVFYSPKLDYRDPARVGDVKIIWELNRLQHLVRLGQAWLLTRDERFPAAACRLVESWIAANPWMHGINWTSAMEAGLRALSLTFLFEYIRDWPGMEARFVQLLAASIHQHLSFIDSHYSLHSSANNHLVAEASGAAVAAAYWTPLRNAAAWHERARALLEREIINQNHPDGVNKEQAFLYQFFVFDLFLLPALQARRSGRAFSSAYHERLERMAEFLAWVTDARGNTPNVGDQDDGRALQLAGPHESTWPSLCHAAGCFFQRADFLRWGSGTLDERNAWLFRPDEKEPYLALSAQADAAPPRRTRLFPDGGYAVLREGEGDSEFLALFDVGPHGWPATAAHAHCDALSLIVHIGGHPVLVDPGTHSYRDGKWRRFSRSAAAHNTVAFSGTEQAEYLNRFMWGRQPSITLGEWTNDDKGVSVAASVVWHTGQRHTRQVEFCPRQGRLTVSDSWSGAGSAVSLGWLLATDVKALGSDEALRISVGTRECILHFEGATPQLVAALHSPVCYRFRETSRYQAELETNQTSTITEFICPA